MDCLDLSQSILFTNDDSIVQREVFELLSHICLISLSFACSEMFMRSHRPDHRQYHWFYAFWNIISYWQENRVPLPENDLCFFDDGQVRQEAISLDLRANLVRPMTASRRSSSWFYNFSVYHVCILLFLGKPLHFPLFMMSLTKYIVNIFTALANP